MIPAFFEIDWTTRRRRQLEMVDRPADLGFSHAFYLQGGGIAVRSDNRVRVLRGEGDRLSLTPVELDVGDFVYLVIAGCLIVTPTAIWQIDESTVTQVASSRRSSGPASRTFEVVCVATRTKGATSSSGRTSLRRRDSGASVVQPRRASDHFFASCPLLQP